MIQYRIHPAQPQAHLFQVECDIPSPDAEGQVFSLPAWIPGSYMVRDFAKNIVQVKASRNGEAIALTKLDKSTWQCAPGKGAIHLEYEIYAWDLSVRTAYLDQDHAFFNGTSVFFAIHGQEQELHEVLIEAAKEAVNGQWRVATGLHAEEVNQQGFGRYSAENYDELIDCPVVMSDFTEVTFSAGGVPHRMVVYGQHDTDMARLGRDLERICSHHIELFGELPAMEHYTFLTMTVGSGYGGLEHRNSTALLCSRYDLPLAHEEEVTDAYRNFLALCSHEYFHTWNVKRIKPAAFLPYDLRSESYTRQLWAFEGITSYYDEYALLRCGLIDTDSYLEMLAQTVTRVLRSPGRHKQSVADSSFDAWTKFYKQDENAPNAIVSYYVKGGHIALALDLLMRKSSQGQTSLDDLMRRLWQDYGKSGIGVPEGRIETLAAELSGTDFSDFFQRYLYGTEDLPLAVLLAELGIELHLRAADKLSDLGGKEASNNSKMPLSLGVRSDNRDEGIALTQVFDGGAAQAAGLSAGDLLIAWNGIRLSKDNLTKLRDRHQAGDNITVHAFRRDELKSFQLTLQEAASDTCYLTLAADATAEQQQRFEAWRQGG